MTPDPIELQVRKMLERQGRFEVLKVLGKGAMGSVVLARDKSLGVRRAIKVINPGFLRSRVIRGRFKVEAKVMARLERDSIVRVYDVGEFEDWLYIVMEYLDGGTLAEHLREFGAMPARQAVEVILRVLDALGAAHTFVDEETSEFKPVIHRDVKPENILFDRRGHSKLADFGIAHIDEHTMALTAAESMMGTFGYMAPEQKKDAAGADHRADIHAVAVLLWMMLSWETGKVEHPGSNDFFLTVGMSGRMDRVPDELQSLILTATAEEPTSRYQSTEEMAAELRAVLPVLPEMPQDTPPLGSLKDVRRQQANLMSIPASKIGELDEQVPHPGTIVPPQVGETRYQAGYSAPTGGFESQVSSVPELPDQFPRGAIQQLPVDDPQDEEEEGPQPILPFGTIHEGVRPMTGTQLGRMEDEILSGTKRKATLMMIILVVLAGLLAGVVLWFGREPEPPARSLDTYQMPQETVTPVVTEPKAADPLELTPAEPTPEINVAAVEPTPYEKPREISIKTPTPTRVESVQVAEPTLESVVEVAKVKLILKSADDGVVLHLSGAGGSYSLSSGSLVATVTPGNYQVTADFDREGAAPGMSVGTLTVEPGLVTVSCRSQMSLCTGQALHR